MPTPIYKEDLRVQQAPLLKGNDIQGLVDYNSIDPGFGNTVSVSSIINPGTVLNDYGTVNSQTLTPQTDITGSLTYPNPSPIPSITALTPPLQATPTETKAQGLSDQLQALNEQLIGQSAYRTSQEQAQGIPGLEQTRLDLANQVKQLQAQALSIPLQLQQAAEGRGITAAGLQPHQDAALRRNAIQALSTSALLEAANGNLALAQQQVDRAVAAKFDPIKEEIMAKSANLQLILNSPNFTREQQNRAQAQLDLQNARAQAVAKQQAQTKAIWGIASTAAQYGADPRVLQKIQNARTPEEAMLIAAQSGLTQDPRIKADLEAARLDAVLRGVQIQKTQYELNLLQKYGGMTPSQYSDYLKDEQKRINAEKDEQLKAQLQGEALREKISLMGGIIESPAIDSVVGTTIFSRAAGNFAGLAGRFAAGATTGAVAGAAGGALFGGIGAIPGAIGGALIGGFGTAGQGFVDRVTGERQYLIGSIEQLVQREFLDNLISVKAQGATFGALQKAEQDALTAAASKIGTWRVRDKYGNVMGYNANEGDFIKEVQTIQRLARTAYERATGELFTSDEDRILNDLWGTDRPDPSLYYGSTRP